MIRTAEENVPKKWWIPLPEERRDEFNAHDLARERIRGVVLRVEYKI